MVPAGANKTFRPYRVGWEKGLAEGLVGYTRRNYLTLVPEFADWPQVFNGDSSLVAALLDRLTHRCHLLEFQGDSNRFRRSLATRRGTPQAAADLTSTAVPLRSDSAPPGRPKTSGKPRPCPSTLATPSHPFSGLLQGGSLLHDRGGSLLG